MGPSLLEEFGKHRKPSSEGEGFLFDLERTCAQDLWLSAGGHWSSESILRFKSLGMEKLAALLDGDNREDYHRAWVAVVRDFHKSYWGESRLLQKEKKSETKESQIFWELFSYIFALIQATLITKTAVFYFGIKSAEESEADGKVYVVLAIAFSFISLTWFAFRKSKKSK